MQARLVAVHPHPPPVTPATCPLLVGVGGIAQAVASLPGPRITRMIDAVPAVPRTSTGSHRWDSMSSNLRTLHGASAYSGENSPPTLCPTTLKPMYISNRARKKLGVARPT